MKKLSIILVAFLLLSITSSRTFAQNVSINADGSMPDTSAMLDVSSTSKGFLLPRMTTAQQNSIVLPAKGLTIFNTTANSIMINTGTASSPIWSALASGSFDTSSITNFSGKVRSLFSGSAPIIYSNGLISISQAGTSSNGYLSSADWNTFNSKGSGTVTNVTATAPLSITSTSTLTPNVVADTSKSAGKLATFSDVAAKQNLVTLTTTGSSGAATFNQGTGVLNIPNYAPGSGTVTSVAKGYGLVADGTITTTGTITVDSAALHLKFLGLKDSTIYYPYASNPKGYLAANQPITVTATGDATGTSTSSSTTPSLPLTLATVNSNVGSFSNATVTVNAKGLVTAVSSGSVTNGTVTAVATGYGLSGGTITSTGTLVLDSATLFTNALRRKDSALYTTVYQNSLKQNQLNGTGFVKANGTTITYDNSTYLTTIDTTNIANFSGKVRSLFSATAPVTYNNGLIGITQAGTSSNGYLSSTDWNTFNNKASATSGWSITGNTSINPLTNFLGTTGNNSVRFRSNNIQRMKIDSTGNVAIGQDVFDATNPEKLVINAGTTSSVNALAIKGSINNYLQMNIQNSSTGNNATTDIVATADNGNESGNYVDLGINGSGYNGSAIQTGVANDGYLISAANDFYLVNSSPNKNLLFLTGGTGVANERLRILANGYVGLGVQDPGAQFVVKDTIQIRRTGAVSQLLFTNTAGTGDFRIGGDGGDLFWQGGGGRDLQMGSYWSTILTGDRQTATYPAFISNTSGTGVIILGQRDASVPLGVQANSASQSANLTEWRNSSGTALSAIDNNGNLGLGTSTPSTKLQVIGTNPISLLGVQLGTNTSTDSVLTISGGVVKKLPASTFSTGTPSGSAGGDLTGTYPNPTVAAGVINNSKLATMAANTFKANNTGSTGSALDITGTQATAMLDNFTSTTKGLVPLSGGGTTNYLRADGTWAALPTALGGWSTAGNTGTTSSTNFLGTTDNKSLKFKTNSIQGMILDSAQNVGIGTAPVFSTSNPEKLLVDAGSSSYNVISGKGNLNGYLQLNIKNSNSGSAASSDVVATNDAGTEANAINYIDMGVNSSGYASGGILGGANNAYLYATGNDFIIGNSSASMPLRFYTTNSSSTSSEAMRIDPNGNLGLGTTTPSSKLHVVGTNPLTLTGVQTGAGTDSILTITGGVVRKLLPSALPTSGWSLTGNSGTSPSTNFLGTTDAQPLTIKINNQLSGSIDQVNTFLGYQAGYSNGTTQDQNTGIGYHALFSNTTGTYNTAIGYGSLPNNGTGSNNIGIGNGADVSGNNSNSIAIGQSTAVSNSNATAMGTSAQATNSYAMAIGSNTYASGTNAIAFGSGISTSKTQAQGTSSIAFGYNSYSGGTNSIAIGTATTSNATNSVAIGNNASANQANSIILGDATNSSLYTGIGTSSPTQKLDVNGNLKLSGAFMPGGSAGTSGYFLQSFGAGTAPQWVDAATYAWLLNGNSVASIKTIGTTTNYDLPFITNNTEKMRITSAGSVGVGTSTFNATYPEKFLVDAGASGNTNYQNVVVGKGNTNSYAQLNIQNNNAGTNASSDVVATSDNGNESANFVDMGVNSSANTTTGVIGGANTGYLYTTGNDFAIGNATASKNLIFFTGGTGSNERMRVDGSGNVGIGTNSPAVKLDVNGTIYGEGSVWVDAANTNTGTKTSALLFGNNTTGEAIASQRQTGGTNQFGLDFYTNGAIHMNVMQGGNVGIGSNLVPTTKLSVDGVITPYTDNTRTLGTSGLRFTTVYATNGALNTSDRRLKKNIKDLTYGLKEVMALEPVSYNWKDSSQTQNKIGLIAQDVRKIVPEVVVGDEAKEHLGMNYGELVPVLINAIKEQQKEIDTLKKDIQLLKDKK